MSLPNNYPQRIQSTIKQKTGLCVGFDPSSAVLASWGLPDTLEGLTVFTERLADVCLQLDVGFVKPQSAFYERFGWEGIKLLTTINTALRRAGIISLLDCKRGDIGSTAAAYADAYLATSDMSKYDAITVNPFLGYDTHQPFIDKLRAESVGIFIVVRSSNAGGDDIQTAQRHGGTTAENQSVALWLAGRIQQDNVACFGEGKQGAIGAVVGATLPDPTPLLEAMPSAFFLCPGIGAQGATFASVSKTVGHYVSQCIFPISRGISLGNPDKSQLLSAIKHYRNELEAIYA